MGRIESFEDLVVWQAAMELMERAYAVSRRLPREERWAMASQLQRSALSVPSNIAEGHGRRHRREYLHLLSVANGSLNETRTILLAATRVGYLERRSLQPTLELGAVIGKQLWALSRALEHPNG